MSGNVHAKKPRQCGNAAWGLSAVMHRGLHAQPLGSDCCMHDGRRGRSVPVLATIRLLLCATPMPSRLWSAYVMLTRCLQGKICTTTRMSPSSWKHQTHARHSCTLSTASTSCSASKVRVGCMD